MTYSNQIFNHSLQNIIGFCKISTKIGKFLWLLKLFKYVCYTIIKAYFLRCGLNEVKNIGHFDGMIHEQR